MNQMTKKVMAGAILDFLQSGLDWDGDYPDVHSITSYPSGVFTVTFDDARRTTFSIMVTDVTKPVDPFVAVPCPAGCKSWAECDESCK